MKEKEKAEEGKGKAKGTGKKGGGEEAIEELEEAIKAVQVGMITGVMNDKTVDLIQVYYANAIHAHPNDLEGKTQACWAVFYH